MSLKKTVVVHITPSFGCGGLEKVIVNVTQYGNAQFFEHHVISLTSDLSFAHALPDHVKIYSVHKQEGKDFGCHLRILKLLRRIKPDVLHTYNFGALEYHVVAALSGVKVRIHADHGMGGDSHAGSNPTKNRFRKVMSTLLHRYVVVSDNLRSWVEDQVGVHPDKVALIRNGVPVPQAMPERHLKADKLVHVGRLAPVKNQKRLLIAFHNFCIRRPESRTTLTLVGDGPCREELEKLLLDFDSDIAKRIHFAGFQDDTTSLYREADAFVLSSDYEAMPMTALEAMSQGTLAILPKVGGIPDSIPKSTAILYPGMDFFALTETLVTWFDMSPSERMAIAVKGFNLSRAFSVERMVLAYENIYRRQTA